MIWINIFVVKYNKLHGNKLKFRTVATFGIKRRIQWRRDTQVFVIFYFLK